MNRLFDRYVPGLRQLAVLVFWVLVGALLGNLVSTALLSMFGQDAGMECATVVSYPVLFIPAMVYAAIRSRRSDRDGVRLDSSDFSPHSGVACAAVAMVATLGSGFCADEITYLLPQMPEALEQMLESMTSGTLWINLLCVSVFAPLFEEWLCRGMVLRGLLAAKMKPVWAIVLSAVFFAVLHMNPWQALPAFLLGVLFGYVYYKTGSLKLTMLMHCTNNTFALILSRIPALEDVDGWSEVLDKPVYCASLAACAAAVVLCVYFFSRIKARSW